MRVPDPFDGSARVRLEHMGLIDNTGALIDSALTVFADIFTGLFFDDLCDFREDTGDLLTIYEMFKALLQKDDYPNMYLLISIQYDHMRKPLPDPVWLLAGDSLVVKAFMTLFMARYKRLMTNSGFIEPGGGVVKVKFNSELPESTLVCKPGLISAVRKG